MTAEEYIKSLRLPAAYGVVARNAFRAGQQNAKSEDFQKLEKKLKEAQKELRELREILDDPEKLAELIAGL